MKPEPVEMYRAPDETLWESGELAGMAIGIGLDLLCLLLVFVIFAAYWRFV